MGLYSRFVGPRVVRLACSSGLISKQRSLIVPQAEGVVLELGIGSGLNLPFYGKENIKKIIGLDPSSELLKYIDKEKYERELGLEVIQGVAENIPLEDNCIDQIVVTYTLCSVEDPVKVLGEVRRVLKPGGRVLLLEHGRADKLNTAKWQRRLAPFWKPIGLGCVLDRSPLEPLAENGFEIEVMDNYYLPSTPGIFGFQYRGIARAR